MNQSWQRTVPMQYTGTSAEEVWQRGDERFDLGITLGKKTNLLKLKKNIVENLKTQQAHFKETRTALYGQADMEDVAQCMVCGETSATAVPRLTIYGANYCQCVKCDHVYVTRRPTSAAISKFYLSDTNYAATYTDKEAAEFRLQTIAVPWLNWLTETYRKVHGRAPRRIVDIGSGAGHFVEACRRAGMEANGIEISESSREFAKQVWGIEQDGRDFLDVADEYAGADVVTFWGLLEHTVNPSSILDAACRVIGKSDAGMVVAKLPRFNSLSSAAQSVSPDTVLRHLDPMGHIMAFTDASAAELYYRCGLRPAAAWYYGMDVYETMMQLSNRAGAYDALVNTGAEQMEIQQWVDEARFADGLVLAGVPRG